MTDATILSFPTRRRPSERPQRTTHPLRKTPARVRWLAMVKAGSVKAAPCRVTDPTGMEIVWYVQDRSPMSTWLGDRAVRALWTPGHRFGPLEPTWVLKLTVEGRKLLRDWSGNPGIFE